MDRRLLLRIGFQAVVTGAFLVLAVRVIDFGSLWDSVRSINLWWVAIALPLFSSAKFVDSFRWRYLLRGVGRPPQLPLFGTFLIGNMVNNLLPFRAGDVAKIQVLASRYGMSRTGVAGSVFVVEATLDGIVFILFMGLGATFLDLSRVPGVTTSLLLGIGVIAVVAFGLAVLLRKRGRQLPLPQRVQGLMENLEEGLDALGSLPRALGAISFSFPAWMLEGAVFAAMGQAFGLQLSLPVYLAAMVAANLAVAIPLGLWNLGPYEALVSGVLVIAGVDEQLAFSYALTTHLVVNLWINISGLVAFWSLGVSVGDLFTLGRDDSQDGERGDDERDRSREQTGESRMERRRDA